MSTTRCHYCDKDIAFEPDNDEYIGRNGHPIPLDIDLAGEILGRHKCTEQDKYIYTQRTRKTYKCYKCGDAIMFDEKTKSKNGKPVPIDLQTALPHLCVQR